MRNGLGLRQIRHIENFHSIVIHNKRVTELNGDATRIVQNGRADGGGDFRRQRIVQVHDNKRFIRQDVGIRSGNGDATRAGQERHPD